MNIFEQKINYGISMIVGVLSAILGKFWFLFVFLLMLNVLDYITGILKARYLHTENSKKAMKGVVKKFLIWCLVALGFGVSIIFEQIGVVVGKNLSIMQCIGWFILTHCIINEIRSILENMVEMDKDNLIPNWLIRGLEVAKNKFDTKAEQFVDKFENNGGNKNEDK